MGIEYHFTHRQSAFPCAFQQMTIVFKWGNRDPFIQTVFRALRCVLRAPILRMTINSCENNKEQTKQETHYSSFNSSLLSSSLCFISEPVRNASPLAINTVPIVSTHHSNTELRHGSVTGSSGEQFGDAKEQKDGSALPEAKCEQTPRDDSGADQRSTFR